MFAVYAKSPNYENPLASLVIGELPDLDVPKGWVRVRITHASLNRHDIFTLRGITAQKKPIQYPMILGNDGAGVLDDGTPVVIYPVLGNDNWKGDETLDPDWHVLGELTHGTMADYINIPMRNAIPIPKDLPVLSASLLGTAWLTAYRAIFTKSRLTPGQIMLVQGASGGMSTALIQLGRAAGIEVWVMTRNDVGASIAEKLGANKIFRTGEHLPHLVDAVIDNVGSATWEISLASVRRGGVVVTNGVTSGHIANTNILRLFVDQIDIRGTIMGTQQEMKEMMNFIIKNNITPEVNKVLPMTDAKVAFENMALGNSRGKIILTR